MYQLTVSRDTGNRFRSKTEKTHVIQVYSLYVVNPHPHTDTDTDTDTHTHTSMCVH